MSPIESNETLMMAEVIPPKLLPRILTRFDLVAIYFALIFGSYGAAQLASKGWASVPILLIATVTFLVPCALAAYELGTLFTGEGGIYIWAHKTFGPAHGFVAGWLSWVPIFLLLPLGATTIIAHVQLLLGVEWPLITQVVAQIAVVWIVTWIALMRIEISQRYIRVFSVVSFSTAILLLITAASASTPIANPITTEIFTVDFFAKGAVYSAAVLWLT